MINEIKKLLREHRLDNNLLTINEISIIEGENDILISAPHTFKHNRNGKDKVRDYFTYSIARILGQLTKCHIIYINQVIDYDPNYDDDSKYYDALNDYISKNNIKYFIDLHGMDDSKQSGLDIGANSYKNVNQDKTLIDEIIKIFTQNNISNITLDKVFASKKNTLSSRINRKFNIKSIQIEISRLYRNLRKEEEKTANLINGLIDTIRYIENKDNYQIMTYKDKLSKKEDIKKELFGKNGSKVFNYSKTFDKVLDIKPLFGYSRKLKDKIEYSEVGLELEVSVTLERDKYSFIKKLLGNIKEIIGDNGFFVKDATILGDYGFEIVLDPLSTEKIHAIYSSLLDVFEFSNGLIGISKAKNCGIHMNFNKYDVTDLEESHKRLVSLLTEKDKYFEHNIYKQSKFIWNFNEYEKFQEKISSKYLWVNYLDGKVIEVRNVRTDLNPIQLIELINKILNALYCDRDNIIFDYENYISLNKIYDTAFDKTKELIFENINNDGFVVISLKDKRAKVIDLDEKTKSILKEKI